MNFYTVTFTSGHAPVTLLAANDEAAAHSAQELAVNQTNRPAFISGVSLLTDPLKS